MLEQLFGQTLFFAAAVGLALVPVYLLVELIRWRRRGKRNLLGQDTLRGPGETLRRKLARLDEKLNDLCFLLLVLPVMATLWTLGPTLYQGGAPSREHYLVLAFLVALFLPVPLLICIRKRRERQNYRLGLDAELAVGRELNLAMHEGFHVFHDFPAEQDNIDHVVVGPPGVFAVETKGRPKTDRDRKTGHATVLYTGEALYFPDNTKETRAITRARDQALFLAEWLGAALGEPVPVQAALALPGWYIERQEQDDLLLLYGQGRHYARSFKANGKGRLAPDLITRITQLLDAKCRDLVPGEGNKAEDNQGKKQN